MTLKNIELKNIREFLAAQNLNKWACVIDDVIHEQGTPKDQPEKFAVSSACIATVEPMQAGGWKWRLFGNNFSGECKTLEEAQAACKIAASAGAPPPRLRIFVRGGCVQDVFSTSPVEVEVIDFDTAENDAGGAEARQEKYIDCENGGDWKAVL